MVANDPKGVLKGGVLRAERKQLLSELNKCTDLKSERAIEISSRLRVIEQELEKPWVK